LHTPHKDAGEVSDDHRRPAIRRCLCSISYLLAFQDVLLTEVDVSHRPYADQGQQDQHYQEAHWSGPSVVSVDGRSARGLRRHDAHSHGPMSCSGPRSSDTSTGWT